MKHTLLTLGSSAPKDISALPPEVGEDSAGSEEVGAISGLRRCCHPNAKSGSDATNLPITLPSFYECAAHSKPPRKSKPVRLRGPLHAMSLPALTLRRIRQDGNSMKATREVAFARKLNSRAVKHWVADLRLTGALRANDAYGTAYDPDPEIRSHMSAILKSSGEPMARART